MSKQEKVGGMPKFHYHIGPWERYLTKSNIQNIFQRIKGWIKGTPWTLMKILLMLRSGLQFAQVHPQ